VRKPLLLVLLACVSTGCVTYDLAGAPSKDLGVGHLYERLPTTAKVAQFRDGSPEGHIQHRLLMRCTDAFAISLRRTDIFERVLAGGGDAAEIGFEGTVERCEGRQNYAFIWAFYSFFALVAVPANLPLSIDDADYVVTLRAIHMPSSKVVGTYQSSVHLHSWRGAWSLFETFFEDPGQVFDIANRDLLNKIVDDFPKFRAVTLRPANAREEPR
jgi:hypothetical protein